MNSRAGPLALVLAAAVAALAATGRSLLQWSEALLLPAYDTAFFQQVVWNLGHGNGFASTFFPASFLGLHFSPLLALPALLERAWDDVRLLAALHALALAASVPAAFLLLRSLLEPHPGAGWIAAALAGPLPFWPAMQQAARAGFHTEALALPLVLLAGGAGLRGRWPSCWGLSLVALTAREDQAYAVLVVAALLLVHGPSRRHGAALAAVALAWGVAAVWLVMPALRGGVESHLVSYYRWLETASADQLAAALANPLGWLAVAGMLVSLAGLPLLRPGWLALAAPPLAADLLSAHQPQPELRLQYALPLVLPLLIAAGLAARRLPARPPAAALAALALPALLAGAASGPVLGRGPVGDAGALARLRACTAALPVAAPAAADDSVAAPLASRPDLRLVLEARPGDHVVVDRAGPVPSYLDPADRERAVAALPGQGRPLLCDDGRFQHWGPAGG